MSHLRPVFRGWFCGCCLVMIVGAARAGTRPVLDDSRGEPQATLLEVHLDRFMISEAIPAYVGNMQLFLPLGELSRELELAIEVDAERGTAQGFVIRPSRKLNLDLALGRMTVAGRSFGLDSGAVLIKDQDLFVDRATLERCLPIRFDGPISDGVLHLRSLEPFPFELKRLRELRAPLPTLEDLEMDSTLTRERDPYALISIPFVDQTVRSIVDNGTGRHHGVVEYETDASGDLLYAQANLHLLKLDGWSGVDLKGNLGRRDPDAGLLGPLNVTEVLAGDLLDPGLDLVTAPRTAPGLLVSSMPLQRPAHFDRQSLAGTLPAGWDVELYRNGLLIGYQPSSQDETYRFEDVPLDFGFNEFHLVFYGPHGERRVESRMFNIDGAMPQPRSFGYRFIASHPSATGPRAHLETVLGISRHLAGSLGAVTMMDDGQQRIIGETAIQWIGGRGYSELRTATDLRGGVVGKLGTHVRWRNLGMGVHHLEVRDFPTEALPAAITPLGSQTKVTADYGTRLPFFSGIPIRLEASPSWNRGAASTRDLQVALRASWRRLAVSHGYVSSAWDDAGNTFKSETHRLDASLHSRSLVLRADFQEAHLSGANPRSGHLSAERNLGSLVAAGAGIGRDGGETRYRSFLGSRQGDLGVTMDLEYGARSGAIFQMALNIGLSRDPRDGQWSRSAKPVAGSGAASALVFLDENVNGKFDANESRISDAVLVAPRTGSVGRTDADGRIRFSGLPTDQPVELMLATQSLVDPAWLPSHRGVRLVPRAGRTSIIDFPVICSGEITGTVRIREDAPTHPLGGVALELRDTTGTVVRETRSAFDGFYDLTEIPPGRYTLQLGAHSSRLYALAPRSIEIKNGSVLDGVDPVLSRLVPTAVQQASGP